MKKITLAILMLILPILFVSALEQINQGTTKNFAILAGETITNTGSTKVTGDIGLYPGTSFVNPEGVTLNGTIHLTDPVANSAKNDLTTVFNQVNRLTPVTRISSELGGQTLLPGIYDSADGTFSITGNLTLNGNYDPNAVFVFKAASTLITASNSTVNLINSVQHCNVYWGVGSSATFGTTSYFVGNVYASSSITATTGAIIDGRLLAMTGAVTLDTNTISNTFCSVTTTVTGGKLPSTSTNLYQVMFIGILLVTIGISLVIFSKHYAKKIK